MSIKFSSVKSLNTYLKAYNSPTNNKILDLKYLVHDRPAPNHILKYTLLKKRRESSEGCQKFIGVSEPPAPPLKPPLQSFYLMDVFVFDSFEIKHL